MIRPLRRRHLRMIVVIALLTALVVGWALVRAPRQLQPGSAAVGDRP
ncbi:MAG TPA: hypothetical protein VEI47_06770 [Gemmatimonadales bacterium]|nr:hypothetical protein [Gemmatimonadales bacterium]